jgi:hypothetical protein
MKATPCKWATRAARAARTRAEGLVVLFDMPSLYASLSRYQANICNLFHFFSARLFRGFPYEFLFDNRRTLWQCCVVHFFRA